MAGIYIHIPFCKTRCIYCDFYSTTLSEFKGRYIQTLCRELEIRRDYLQGAPIETIYLGGGTPSQLTQEDFLQIFETIERVYGMKQVREITLEANPDDLTPEYTRMLATLPFNRISMGIQTFNEKTLQLLKRRHTAPQAIAAVALNVEHISAYHLIYEEGTPMYNMLQQHRISEVDEESSVGFFSELIDQLTTAGYEHYEISNFSRPGYHSQHNTAYWKNIPYLGCGPSAHSFNRQEREWNIASLNDYINGIENGKRIYETEDLNTVTRYNEFIITSLRTCWGIPLAKLKEEFGTGLWQYCLDSAALSLKNGKLIEKDNALRLTREGIFISDSIMSDLLKIEE